MRIGGFIKFSLIDYPGKLAAVIFTQGCNFRCAYCYNPELVIPQEYGPTIEESEVLEFLKKRAGTLNGVVVTGGEPTIHHDLIEFLEKIKQLKYPIRLNTNGSNPEILREIIHLRLIDSVAMDIKAPLSEYEDVAGIMPDTNRLEESIYTILNSGLEYEFQTVLVKPICTGDKLERILSSLQDTKHYGIRRFIPNENVLNKRLLKESQYSEEEIERLKSRWEIK